MKQPRKIWWLILIIVCVSVVPSCMITRLRQVKRHLCEFDSNFDYDSNNGFLLTFKIPTLYDRDMITLAGSGPSEVLFTENRKTAKYIFRQKDSDNNSRITLVHEYIKEGDEFRLDKYRIGPNLSKIVTEELITYALRSGCTLKIRGRTVTLKFGDEIETYLPNKALVRQTLGEPNVDKHSSFVYYYYLLNSTKNYDYRAEIIFDEQSSVVSGVNLDYFLYRVEIDFKGRIAIAKVKDYLGFVRLSLNVGLSP